MFVSVTVRTCLLVCLVAVMASLAGTGDAVGQRVDEGSFDGAVWRFTLKPKTKGVKPLGGLYRVQGNDLYQKETLDAAEYKKVVGKKVTGRKGKVDVEFTDLSAINRAKELTSGIQGKALLTYDQFGSWSGTFIDAQGQHWEFKCTRVQD